MVLHKIGISRIFLDFAQKSGFQAPMSKILGFQVPFCGFHHGRPWAVKNLGFQIVLKSRFLREIQENAAEIHIFCSVLIYRDLAQKSGFQRP